MKGKAATEKRLDTPPSQIKSLNGPGSTPHTPQDGSPKAVTPMGTPPDLPPSFPQRLTDHSAQNVALEIIKVVKEHDHLVIEKELEAAFISEATKILTIMTAPNGRHYIDTCDESSHFQDVFIAHMVEKLVNILNKQAGWVPDFKNLKILIQEVDEALKEEDDFHFNKGEFVSWHEPEEGLLPPPCDGSFKKYANSEQTIEVPIIGGSCSDASLTTAGGSTDSNNSLVGVLGSDF